MRLLTVPDQIEAEVQRATIAFYRTFGIEVARFSEGRRTRIAPGWPDLGCFCLRKGAFWVHETKRTRGGIHSDDQLLMQSWFETCGIPYLLGGVQAAHDHLVDIGVLEP